MFINRNKITLAAWRCLSINHVAVLVVSDRNNADVEDYDDDDVEQTIQQQVGGLTKLVVVILNKNETRRSLYYTK